MSVLENIKFELPPLAKYDYEAHNREVKEVWDSFNKKHPVRMPVVLGVNPRVLLQNPKYNVNNITHLDYSNDPEIMMSVQCWFCYYMRHYLMCDQEMGMPDGFSVWVDFANCGEASWLGAPLKYYDSQLADTEPFLDDDNKNQLFEKGIPDPFSRIMEKNLYFYNYMMEHKLEFMGMPVKSVVPGCMGTDGPMTIACSIRGATEFCIDLYEDTEYAMKLLEFITEATITRIKAWRRYTGQAEISDNFGFADDSIALLSVNDYKRFILPFHKRLRAELSTGSGDTSIHLCGDASRHFPVIKEELQCMSFDTGFPIDHAAMAQKLGPDVVLQGGPHVSLLRHGTAEEVRVRTKGIIDSVRPYTRNFVMREANNLSPCTPEENVRAMYETTREYGRY